MPSYSWGGHSGFSTFLTKKAFEVARIVMQRRNVEFVEEDQEILEHIFEEIVEDLKSSVLIFDLLHIYSALYLSTSLI